MSDKLKVVSQEQLDNVSISSSEIAGKSEGNVATVFDIVSPEDLMQVGGGILPPKLGIGDCDW